MAATIRLDGWRTQLPGQLVRTVGQTRLLLRQQPGQFGDDLWMLAGNVMPLAGIAAQMKKQGRLLYCFHQIQAEARLGAEMGLIFAVPERESPGAAKIQHVQARTRPPAKEGCAHIEAVDGPARRQGRPGEFCYRGKDIHRRADPLHRTACLDPANSTGIRSNAPKLGLFDTRGIFEDIK